jgi:hypothetical protein
LKSLGIDEPFAKAARRSRHGYSAEEDDAILKGFRKHNNSWAAIRSDLVLGLSHRKAMDLRDRFRTRFPEEYAKAGLALRPEKLIDTPRKEAQSPPAGEEIDTAPSQDVSREEMPQVSALYPASTVELLPASTTTTMVSNVVPHRRTQQQPSLFSLDEIFLGTPFTGTSSFPYDNYDYTGNDNTTEPIVLDRGILDWATADAARTSAATTANGEAVREAARISGGIDPLMTLVLPKPAGLSLGGGGRGEVMPLYAAATTPALPSSQPNANAANSLPSLADLLPADYNFNASGTSSSLVDQQQLELPSLMQWYPGNMAEERGSGTVGSANLTLEELLS